MAAISWLANPLLWMGYLAMVRARYAVAILFGLGAVILALIPPVHSYVAGRNVFPAMPYCWWAWLAAMILLIFTAELAYDLSPERAVLESQWARNRDSNARGRFAHLAGGRSPRAQYWSSRVSCFSTKSARRPISSKASRMSSVRTVSRGNVRDMTNMGLPSTS